MRQRLGCFTNLPEELQSEILLKLPTRSLLVCRWVCKAFRSLIGKSNFIQTHLARISSTNLSSTFDNSQSLILVFGDPNQYPYYRHEYRHCKHFLLSVENTTKDLLAYLQITPPVPIFENRDLLTVVGSCNGLICLCVWFNTNRLVGEIYLLLWNPVIRQCRYLPTPKFKTSGDHFQFGFVSETNDYVVIKVGSSPQFCVEVYKMSTDEWTIVDCSSFDAVEMYPVHHGGNTVLLDGSFHWTSMHDDNIVYYNIKDEKVGVMKAVDDKRVLKELTAHEDRLSNISKLVVIDESLAIMYWNQRRCTKLEIWVMKDYGVQGSWTRQFEIVEDFYNIYHVGCWTDQMMITEEMMRFQLYDLNSRRRIWELPTLEAYAMDLIGCFRFVETLVPVRSMQ